MQKINLLKRAWISLTMIPVIALTFVSAPLCEPREELPKEAGLTSVVTDEPEKPAEPTEPQTKAEETAPQTPSNVPTEAVTPKTPIKKPTDTSPKQEPKPQSTVGNGLGEIRGVWIPYMELETMLKKKTKKEFSAAIRKRFETCYINGFNTVIVHVRSHGDAYYMSRLFPPSFYATGARSKALSYDPLAIMVTEAHRLGLRLEAWINPYRSARTSWALAAGETTAAWKNTEKVKEISGIYYFNPGEPQARQLILDGVSEILNNYAVDGIHFDDYFYPSGWKSTDGTEPIDAATFAEYGDGKTLGEFRTDSVNALVKGVYDLVQAAESRTGRKITFGISPAGNISNCLHTLYADVKLWGKTPGYVDYLAPQLYWAYGQGSLPYEKALAQWQETVTGDGIDLLIGLAAYRVGMEGEPHWSEGDVLARQITDARNTPAYRGFFVYRYDDYFSERCATERKNFTAILH